MKSTAVFTLLVAVWCVSRQPVKADSLKFTFTTVSFPGSSSSVATGINNAGQIVGTYTDTAGKVHGFLDTNGVYKSIDVPGSTQTIPTGINNAGQIVGASDGHVFVDTNGVFTTPNIPGQVAAGYSGGFFSPNAKLGINDSGKIVGTTLNPDPTHPGEFGFLYSNGMFTLLGPMGPLRNAIWNPTGINDAGQITISTNPGGPGFSFVYPSGPSIPSNLGVLNVAIGINNRGQVVEDLAIPTPVSVFTNVLVNPDGAFSTFLLPFIALGLNDADQIVGNTFEATPIPEPTSPLLLVCGLAAIGIARNRRRAAKLYPVLTAFFLFGSALFGDSIATYSALSATVASGGGGDSMSASGPYFSTSGTSRDYSRFIVRPGDQLRFFANFSTAGAPGGPFFASVDFLGNGRFDSAVVSGSISAFSSVSFTVPANPQSTYTFSGTAGGQFTATPVGGFCGRPGWEPCDATANLDIGLPGIITVGLTPFTQGVGPNCTSTPGPFQCQYEVVEGFMSTPEPSSAALLVISSAAIFVTSIARRKRA
jgi:probable HAF family extracellular repeat protein